MLFILLISCGSDNRELINENIDEEENVKLRYRTYKNQVPMMNTGRKKLEEINDIENARRNILKTYDGYKTKVKPNSQQ